MLKTVREFTQKYQKEYAILPNEKLLSTFLLENNTDADVLKALKVNFYYRANAVINLIIAQKLIRKTFKTANIKLNSANFSAIMESFIKEYNLSGVYNRAVNWRNMFAHNVDFKMAKKFKYLDYAKQTKLFKDDILKKTNELAGTKFKFNKAAYKINKANIITFLKLDAVISRLNLKKDFADKERQLFKKIRNYLYHTFTSDVNLAKDLRKKLKTLTEIVNSKSAIASASVSGDEIANNLREILRNWKYADADVERFLHAFKATHLVKNSRKLTGKENSDLEYLVLVTTGQTASAYFQALDIEFLNYTNLTMNDWIAVLTKNKLHIQNLKKLPKRKL